MLYSNWSNVILFSMVTDQRKVKRKFLYFKISLIEYVLKTTIVISLTKIFGSIRPTPFMLSTDVRLVDRYLRDVLL